MQLHMTDKAIEFNSEYEKLERVLNALREANMDVSSERKEAVALKAQIDHDVLNMIDPVEIESMYDEGIKKLSKINDSLKKYEVYYTAYNSAGDIERKISDKEVNQTELKTYSSVTISLLKKINSSDTRSFQSEEKVVDKVYDVAYSIIKLELLTTGKSDVLAWVRTDSVAANLIDTRIFEDIATVPTDSSVYAEIRNMLANINTDHDSKKKDAINSGLNYTALDEGLILFLALQDSQNIERIESSLFQTINELLESEKEERNQEVRNNEFQSGIADFTDKMRSNRIYKQIALALGLVGLLIGIKQGSDAIAKNIGHNEFRTRLDYYSSEEGELPEYPEYMKGIKNNSKTTLKAYGPWTQEGVFYGDYERDVVTFDLSDIDLDNLEDFSEIDFSSLSPSSTEVETASELDPSMLYEQAIVEITRLIQDPNDKIFVPNESAKEVFLTVMAVVEAVLGTVGGGLIVGVAIKKLKERFKNGSLRKSELAALKDGLKRYEELTIKNEEFRKRFVESYQKYSRIIKNSDLKEKCESILQRIKSE